MEMLQVGVIGTGAIGRSHIERLNRHVTGARVVAVSDINRKAAQEIAETYHAKCYAEGEDLIRDPEVQAVIVCSWDPTHEKYVLEAIRQGKFVFCEKPLAETVEACKHIVDAEIADGKQLVQVGFMRRFDRDYLRMKQALDSGSFGAPLMVHCVHRNATSNDQYETKVNVTGTAIHEIDAMRWLLGEDIVSARIVQPRVSRHVANGNKDPQIIMLQTKSGVIIDVETFLHCRYGYEIIAGHRRCRASELAGLEVLPCIVREMTDHEAIREMRDSNKQRDGMLPTELARLLDLEMEDIKHQGVPLKNVAEGDIGKRSAEIVGEAHGIWRPWCRPVRKPGG